MKNIFKLFMILAVGATTLVGCGDDDSTTPEELEATLGADLTVEIETTVTLDATATVGTISTFEWMVTDPDGTEVSLDGATTSSPSFIATKGGTYDVDLTVASSTGVESTAMGSVIVENPSYETADQMGRPAINTVFNFFGTAEVKNGYNETLPSNGSDDATAFAGILDALQTYIGLDPEQFENILGIGNDALAGVLAVDVLQSDKGSATAYGSLNGRALADDVIDVTLTLAFGDQSTAGEANAVKDGLVSDNVGANDKSFTNSFPYLADPH
ncbi:DUF4331 family protein [Ekhidna sp.]